MRERQFVIRVTDYELADWHAIAEAQGKPLSALIREFMESQPTPLAVRARPKVTLGPGSRRKRRKRDVRYTKRVLPAPGVAAEEPEIALEELEEPEKAPEEAIEAPKTGFLRATGLMSTEREAI